METREKDRGQAPRVLSFGGGVNSTALLLGLVDRDEPPDRVLFADTGSEWPSTYEHVAEVSAWLRLHGLPAIEIIHRGYERHATLEDECHNLATLPSKAFGYSGCSVKWKRQPMDRAVRQWAPAQEAWARGELVTRLIGIGWDEQHRGKIPDCTRFHYEFPLIEWRWDRERCIEEIQRHGLAVPRKSACFFCPATTKREVLAIAREEPDLFRRAVAIEVAAEAGGKLQKVKGLGRHWSWTGLVAAEDPDLLPETPHEFCIECADGAIDD